MFGGMFGGDDIDLNPEDFDSPFEFVKALLGSISPETCERNIQLLSTLWGAKTGRNPRYLFADQLAMTGDDEMWEKIQLPRVVEQFDLVRPAVPPTEARVSDEGADELRRMFEVDETHRGHHRQFTVGSDGQTEEAEPEE